MVAGVVLAIVGVWWAATGDTSEVKFKAVEGISVFAVLYVIAQAAERVTEWVVDLLSLIPESPEQTKKESLKEVRVANSTLNGNPRLADFGPQLGTTDSVTLSAVVESAANRTSAAAETKKEAEKKVDEARRDITFLAHGVSIVVCALAVNWLNYGLLQHIGAEGVDGGLDRLFTALAAAGGTKALHELIGRFQKSKEATETGESS